MTSREAIFAALFAKAAAAPGLVTTSRAVRGWDAVPSAEQPALFQSEGRQTAVVVVGQPTKWTLRAELIIYVHAATCGAPDVVTALNAIVDSIVAALEREPGSGRQTLGGLVTDARIQGDIETDEGRLGQQAVAIIPIEIISNV
jgi:hypothetical protein